VRAPPLFLPPHIAPHVVKGHVKQAQGPRDLPSHNPGTTETPPGIPLLPRDKDPAYWNPGLAVARGHDKHAQDPHDPVDLTRGKVTMTSAAHSPISLHSQVQRTTHGPSPPTHPPLAYPPHAHTAAPRPRCQLQLQTAPSLPIIAVHGVKAAFPGLHTPDRTTRTGSLLSREGNPAYWIPPPAGGVQHPGQPGRFSRIVRPNTDMHGLCRSMTIWKPLEIRSHGRTTPPLAPRNRGNPTGILHCPNQTCNINSKHFVRPHTSTVGHGTSNGLFC
jgi:hypothetical protein